MNKDDKKTIAVNFRKQLETFTSDVHELTKNSELTTKREFLQRIAHDVNNLYASSVSVQKEINDEIEEIGSMVQNIFVQPLTIAPHHSASFLKAVESFGNESERNNDLSHIMRQYVNHPESTKSFIRELELLREDLDEALKKIA